MENNNLLDIDVLIFQFIKKYEQSIKILHKSYFNNNIFSIEDIIDDLKNGYEIYLHKKDPQQDLESYLFYIVNDFYKKKLSLLPKRKIEYICPGCFFLGNSNILEFNGVFNCICCKNQLELSIDPKNILLFKTFAVHNKYGYHCKDCNRFIPHPMDAMPNVSCPYFDCCFVGTWSSLKRMFHPINKFDTLNNVSHIESSVHVYEHKLQNNISLLKDIINSQINNIIYLSSEFTIQHKICCCQAFLKMLDKFPLEMVNYLLYNSRNGGFQQKIFQEYINLLEKSLPYSFKKNNKIYKVESLLDEQLSLFDGISVFDAIVSDKLEVKNNTKEFYIGGRKATYAKPFYIGKLLSINNKNTGESLLNNVEEYGFFKIKMKNIMPSIEVCVTHLRVPPHYQMGGMVYVNRLRKNIVESAMNVLNNE